MDTPHPLWVYLKQRGPTIDRASEEFAQEVSAAGTPVKARTIRAIADGNRRPRPPLSEIIAEKAGIDELTLLKWGRHATPQAVAAVEPPAAA